MAAVHQSMQQGIQAIQAGNLAEGERLLRYALKDPALKGRLRATALNWLGEILTDRDEKIRCFEEALDADPGNDFAEDRLADLLKPPKPNVPPPPPNTLPGDTGRTVPPPDTLPGDTGRTSPPPTLPGQASALVAPPPPPRSMRRRAQRGPLIRRLRPFRCRQASVIIMSLALSTAPTGADRASFSHRMVWS